MVDESCGTQNSAQNTGPTAIGRPRKRWEDDINEFLKLVEDETENLTKSSSQINKTWINTAKDSGRWALLEEKTQLLQKNDRKILRERE